MNVQETVSSDILKVYVRTGIWERKALRPHRMRMGIAKRKKNGTRQVVKACFCSGIEIVSAIYRDVVTPNSRVVPE
jgi:hypothetical protein